MSKISTFLRSSSLYWATGGWTFFIAENLILSENRTYLVETFGDASYHNGYGLISTMAMGSVAYAYWFKIRDMPPLLWSSKATLPFVPLPWRLASWICFSLGLGMASQTLPKFQLPVVIVSNPQDSDDTSTVDTRSNLSKSNDTASTTPPKSSFQVRCPFDFTDKKTSSDEVKGLDRISRHPGLWSFGLIGLGQSCLVPSIPQRLWLMMPLAVAWIGGAHTDSRFRRGMGGTLEPEYDRQTSNIPFAAMITSQGGWEALIKDELKLWNVVAAMALAAAHVFSRRYGALTSAATMQNKMQNFTRGP
jgi:uncharacterized membrane protein